MKWIRAGSDNPRKCLRCRYKRAAFTAAGVALGGLPYRLAEAEEFLRLARAVGREIDRLDAAGHESPSRSAGDPKALAEAAARLAATLHEMRPWTAAENCSCTRGGCRPRRAGRRARA